MKKWIILFIKLSIIYSIFLIIKDFMPYQFHFFFGYLAGLTIMAYSYYYDIK